MARRSTVKPATGTVFTIGHSTRSRDELIRNLRAHGIGQLVDVRTVSRSRRKRPTAIMCAEAVPWRCHRSLIADVLTASGVAVRHIMSPASARLHAINPMAKTRGGKVAYPGS